MYKEKRNLFFAGIICIILAIMGIFINLNITGLFLAASALPFMALGLTSLFTEKDYDVELSITINRSVDIKNVVKIIADNLYLDPLQSYIAIGKLCYKKRVIIFKGTAFECEHLAHKLHKYCSINIYYPNNSKTYIPGVDCSKYFAPKLKLKMFLDIQKYVQKIFKSKKSISS